MSVKITSFEVEDVKRVKAVSYEPSQNGLTVIGGNNGQGKTSILDSLIWGLGGDKYAPSKPRRDDAAGDPHIKIELSNGLTVERKGKNSSLTVTDTTGMRGGQKLLQAFVAEFALDLPKFMNATTKEKSQILLRSIGIGDQLAELDKREKSLYDHRHSVGVVADSKEKHAKELPYYHDAPNEPVSVADLVAQAREINAQNADNQKARDDARRLQEAYERAENLVADLATQLAKAQIERNRLLDDRNAAAVNADKLVDKSTADIDHMIADAEAIHAKVIANKQREAATEEARKHRATYDDLTAQIETVRASRIDLLNGVKFPLDGLSVEAGALVYNGKPWDCMSGSEQLRVATAIARGEKPECGFVFLDELEKMDLKTMNEFGAWVEAQGMQVIATRVSTGDECSIIIEDGLQK